ncbi:unnamed protein product [Tilletia controversa]|uniref:Alginate lyase domain-containing protein n=3 Tax=Tilletia TaxID=13289 RepID=A0A8X7MSV1_9BASI|nr:hypothetical protein CF335_g5475 [Tilletia laevis]KAE8196871.1 hypothetical protein CF328_g4014 [Tilletia controversa]KAE8256294.1 hypothetical protein A4X03_0g5435 [Tilletia caries]KAE8247065.1 hypothetical protein A4X06_0g4724 [Tilletia controversa]CAD6888479.1 unnamed protein product [Tilletia caries]
MRNSSTGTGRRRSQPARLALLGLFLQAVQLAPFAKADGNDWVSPLYIERLSNGQYSPPPGSSAARQQIINSATWSAADGPWSVTNSKVVPASKNNRDYLSWAPYWWPDCNWCGQNAAQSDGKEGTDPEWQGDTTTTKKGGPTPGLPVLSSVLGAATPLLPLPPLLPRDVGHIQSNTARKARPASSPTSAHSSGFRKVRVRPSPATTPAPTPSTTIHKRGGSNTIYAGNGHDSGDAKNSGKAAAGGEGSNKCTPSRTSVAPTATWTTCPYKQRDGKLNPDVRSLNNTKDVVSMANSVFYNGVAYGLTNQTVNAERAASFVYNWFLDPRKGVNPALPYGQVIRGPPGEQEGGYTGIIDWRMLMKVVNTVVILRSRGAESWNAVLAAAANSWANKYLTWLQTSQAGKDMLAKGSNNHASFFYNQVIALYILQGDLQGAQAAVNTFFTGAFMKQIIATGEQPFEAARTRPFHYRCFNLEALIANAKMADNLALNMWSARTEKGATIQTAVDFTMTLDAEDEDVTELAPHVSAVAAAYGDPTGKYARWLANSKNTGDPENKAGWRVYNDKMAFYSR